MIDTLIAGIFALIIIALIVVILKERAQTEADKEATAREYKRNERELEGYVAMQLARIKKQNAQIERLKTAAEDAKKASWANRQKRVKETTKVETQGQPVEIQTTPATPEPRTRKKKDRPFHEVTP